MQMRRPSRNLFIEYYYLYVRRTPAFRDKTESGRFCVRAVEKTETPYNGHRRTEQASLLFYGHFYSSSKRLSPFVLRSRKTGTFPTFEPVYNTRRQTRGPAGIPSSNFFNAVSPLRIIEFTLLPYEFRVSFRVRIIVFFFYLRTPLLEYTQARAYLFVISIRSKKPTTSTSSVGDLTGCKKSLTNPALSLSLSPSPPV